MRIMPLLFICLILPIIATAQVSDRKFQGDLLVGRSQVLASSHNNLTGQQTPEAWHAKRIQNGVGASLKWHPIKAAYIGINGYYSIKNPRAVYRQNRYSRGHLFAGGLVTLKISDLPIDLSAQFEMGRIAGGSFEIAGDTWNYGTSTAVGVWVVPNWSVFMQGNFYCHGETSNASVVLTEKYRLIGLQCGIRYALSSAAD